MPENNQIEVWVDQARQGDALAVSKLLATFHPVLRARAVARMDPAIRAKVEPEDILQQVYLDVFREIDRFEDRGPDSFLNWVLTILDNELVDTGRALHRHLRDISREMRPDALTGAGSYWNLLDQLHPDSVTPSQVVRREEAVGALLACISRLSDSHQQVIQLRFLEGHSVSEVAERLGKSDAAVVSLTRRALEALRKSMDRLGEFTRGS
jgi:RNA polymerase sigma-70 factor (ECF subfamily)